MPLRVKFQRFSVSEPLFRSSHSLNVVNGKAYLFGGEIQPRQPVDNVVTTLALDKNANTVNAKTTRSDDAPLARVGHAAAVVGNDIFVFGGRGGKDMKPLEENGRVWSYSITSKSWSFTDPPAGAAFPEARSYHSAASSQDTLFIHAGCPASGRASDLWSFRPADKVWKQLPSAPQPARGGPGLVYAVGKVWRYGGFDGKQELGGQLDYLDVSSTGESSWQSVSFEEAACPGPRSVTGLQCCKVGGKHYLVAYMGERDASSKGHEGAGMFWDDIWSLELSSEGQPSPRWDKCSTDEKSDKIPARGWFASDKLDDLTIVVYGGLNGQNCREADGYLIEVKA